jgi:hypothetical protein
MTIGLPLLGGREAAPPTAPFIRLSTLWIQITGTWCNLRCTHCLNASGPGDPWLKPLGAHTVRQALREAERLGVRDIYFTGGGSPSSIRRSCRSWRPRSQWRRRRY